jgi:xanthine/uracil permease
MMADRAAMACTHLAAAIPLIPFSVISQAEATSQALAIGEAVRESIDRRRRVPKIIRGDGVTTLIGGISSTSLIIWGDENIGKARVIGVRSRYVTATRGVLLVLVELTRDTVVIILAGH